MYIPNTVAWGGPGKTWIKDDDGWKEYANSNVDSVRSDAEGGHEKLNKDLRVLRYVKVASNACKDQGCWLLVNPKTTRQSSEYRCLGDLLFKLHASKSGEKLRQFNYMLPLMDLIIKHKFSSLGGSAKRYFFLTIKGMMKRVTNTYERIRDMKIFVKNLLQMLLDNKHCYWSDKAWTRDVQSVQNWANELEQLEVPSRQDDGLHLMDIPPEIVEMIPSWIDDHQDLENLRSVNIAFSILCNEPERWKDLCFRHFSPSQIKASEDALGEPSSPIQEADVCWREKYYYLLSKFEKKVTCDSFLLCSTCGMVFWKDCGHPCSNEDVRAEPVSPKALLSYFL